MVGMCGEAAADPLLIPLLISFGLGEFSVSAPSILRTRKIISQWTKAEADALAEKVLALKTKEEVKAALEAACSASGATHSLATPGPAPGVFFCEGATRRRTGWPRGSRRGATGRGAAREA